MPSRMVVLRERSARLVTHSARTHANEVAGILTRQLEPHLEPGEQMPDIKLLLTLLARYLDGSMAELNAAEAEHKTETREDAEAREMREEANDSLYGAVSGLRSGAELVFGPPANKDLGFSGSTPRDPTTLLEFARRVAPRIDKLKGLKPVRGGITLDIGDLKAQLAEGIARLDRALKDVARESRETEALLTRKARLQASHDRAFSATAGALESLFRLAGQDELASRVRPSRRRPGRIHEEDELLPVDAEPAADPTPELA